MAKLHPRCPDCGRPLVDLDEVLHIGRCSHHDRWYALEEGAENAAYQKNSAAAQQKEQLRLAEQSKRLAKAAEEKAKQRTSKIRAFVLVLIAVLAITAAVFVFLIKPTIKYEQADDLRLANNYSQAIEIYQELGDYRDAPAKIVLCQVEMDIANGNISAALKKYDDFQMKPDNKVNEQLRSSFRSVLNNWTDLNILPNDILPILARCNEIDPMRTLDINKIEFQVHAAMLTNASAFKRLDIDADGKDELIAINDAVKVSAYRMDETGNAQINITSDTNADLLVGFGNDYADESLDKALACYLEALRFRPDKQIKSLIAGVYRKRSERSNTLEAALADAKQAVIFSEQKEDFVYYYEIMHNSCMNEVNTAEGLERWSAFVSEENSSVQKFDLYTRANVDTGRLYLLNAADMALANDFVCIEYIRKARELGADVEEAILNIIARQ